MKKTNLLSPVFPAEKQIYLNAVIVTGVEIDVCPATGGIWFDRFELNNFDEEHEDISKLLKAIPQNVQAPEVLQMRRSPRHPDIIMMKQPFGPKGMNDVLTVDVCPMSAGIWLDHNEILKIRELYPTAELKERLSQAFVESVFKEKMAQSQPIEKAQKVKKAQSMFDFLSKLKRTTGTA